MPAAEITTDIKPSLLEVLLDPIPILTPLNSHNVGYGMSASERLANTVSRTGNIAFDPKQTSSKSSMASTDLLVHVTEIHHFPDSGIADIFYQLAVDEALELHDRSFSNLLRAKDLSLRATLCDRRC
jgi:hypothetical protein